MSRSAAHPGHGSPPRSAGAARRVGGDACGEVAAHATESGASDQSETAPGRSSTQRVVTCMKLMELGAASCEKR